VRNLIELDPRPKGLSRTVKFLASIILYIVVAAIFKIMGEYNAL